MLTHPMLDQLGQIGLSGMAQAFAELESSTKPSAHPCRLARPVARSRAHPPSRQAAGCSAALCHTTPGGQRRGRRLTSPERPRRRSVSEAHQWRVDRHDNLILCGPTGVGKSWLACAPGSQGLRDNRSVLYQRVHKLFAELARPLCPHPARPHRRPAPHPRPPRSQRPSRRSRRRQPETPTVEIDLRGLTTSLQLCQKPTASSASASQATSSRIAGRHHLGIKRATSSESAVGYGLRRLGRMSDTRPTPRANSQLRGTIRTTRCFIT